jgi:hypothetical protein
LEGAYGTDKLGEGSKDIPEDIDQSCLFIGGKSLVEDFSMVLAKHCSDFEADKRSYPWKYWMHLADYMVPQD